MAKEIVLKDALENMGAQMVDRDLQAQEEQNNVKNIKIEVTLEELLLVTALLSDQLFRREFIDPKMPGYKGDPAELAMGKDLILRLKSMAREASGLAVAAASRRAPSHSPLNRMEFQMPFEQFTPRSFTAVSVRANAPTASGIYGISNAQEWIFIGETDNIQASLLHDLQQGASALLKRSPTGFVFELCGAAERRARQDWLILEYEPVCNRRLLGDDMGGTI